MPKRSKAELDILITIAAGLFAIHTRDAKEIANLLDTSERSVHRWAERGKMGRSTTNPQLRGRSTTLESNPRRSRS